jgi:hypothetical protein
MTKFLLATAAAGAVVMAGSAALAAPAQSEPMRLDEAQMDGVSAGALVNFNLGVSIPTQVIVPTAVAVSINGDANAGNIVKAVQWSVIKQQIGL